jgi:serine protease
MQSATSSSHETSMVYAASRHRGRQQGTNRRRVSLRGLGVALVFALLGIAGGARASAAETAKAIPNEVIVKVKPAAGHATLAALEAIADADRDEELSTVGSGVIRRIHSRSKGAEQLMSELQRHPDVVYSEPNYIVHTTAVPNDPSFSQLWAMNNTGQTILGVAGKPGAHISAESAWTVTTGSHGVVVGVVDTGFDYTHNDLAANAWSNPGGVGGCPAGTHGFNAITKSCDPADDNLHGTHVSGTIGAVGNNALGVVGVNWTTTLMGLKFLDSTGSGLIADAISAIDFAVSAKLAGVNVRILSNSWGGAPFSQSLLDEIEKANSNDILFVAAAGNNGTSNDSTPFYPASYNSPNVIAVAATDNDDNLASFSNFGAGTVHLGAPGVNVLSTVPGNQYQFLSGTSMATPHVAGAAALILSQTGIPPISTSELKSSLLGAVDSIPSLAGKTVTGGRLDVCKGLFGCSATLVANFTWSCNGLTCTLDASSSTGPIASYTWLFHDTFPLSSAAGKTVTHTFAGPFTYEVDLFIADAQSNVVNSDKFVPVP